MNRRLEQWRRLPRDERRLLVKLAVILPVVGAALRCFGLRRTCQLVGEERRSGAGAESADAPVNLASAERLARLVDIASRHGAWRATCLPRSLVLCSLLHRGGHRAELRIGVRKGANGEAGVRAHAWVELGGRVINDRLSVVDDYAAYESLAPLFHRGAGAQDAR